MKGGKVDRTLVGGLGKFCHGSVKEHSVMVPG